MRGVERLNSVDSVFYSQRPMQIGVGWPHSTGVCAIWRPFLATLQGLVLLAVALPQPPPHPQVGGEHAIAVRRLEQPTLAALEGRCRLEVQILPLHAHGADGLASALLGRIAAEGGFLVSLWGEFLRIGVACTGGRGQTGDMEYREMAWVYCIVQHSMLQYMRAHMRVCMRKRGGKGDDVEMRAGGGERERAGV